MSICPTCGHWTAEPVPEGLEDSIKPCRTCARRQRSGDAELVESVGKYRVQCYGCHLSTGDYNDPREAVAEWNALWEGVEGPQEAPEGPGSAESIKHPSEARGGHTGETRGINGAF